MEDKDTGILIHQSDILLQRNWFKQMCHLIGINVLYRSPKDATKTYDKYGELDTLYNSPIKISCIYDEHPTIWTMKKLGWNSELQEGLSVIHVPYDLEGLQVGSLFEIPSAIDNSKARVFKVIRMSTIQVYPASIACEIGPMFTSNFIKSNMTDFENSDFNLLNEEEED